MTAVESSQRQPNGIEAWTTIADDNNCIGAFLNRGEDGVEAYDADDVLLDVFADEAAAADAIIDCWDRKSQLNGSTPAVSEKPRSMLAAALGYAERGWDVFPAPPGAKKSYKSAEHSNGAKWGKTRDPKQIRKDFRRWPQANVGIPTGAENGIFVLETDTPEGHDVNGDASLQALEAEHGPLPKTLMAQSPSGSLHRYFKHPGEGIKVINSASMLGPGIDIRGDGGMVIAPPSVRRDGEYRWLNDNPIADAPQWLVGRATTRNSGNGAKGHLNLADLLGFRPTPLSPAFAAAAAAQPMRSLAGGIVIESVLLPIEPILAECPWLRHVHDTGGVDQSERLWWDALRTGPFLEDGESLIHKFSERHEEYGKGEKTAAKFEQVRKAKEAKNLGYPKCQTISDHGSEQCKTCRHLAAGKSPLHHGRNQQPAKPAEPADPKAAALAAFVAFGERMAAELPDDSPPLPKLFLTLAEWEARDLPAPDYILGNVISTTTRMLLAADTGIGKTMFCLAMGMRCALGCGFLHWTGIRPAKVLYIDGEMSNRQFKQRLADEAARLGTKPETFFALSREDIPNLQPLNTHDGQVTIEAIIREYRIEVVIFDNIMALISGNHAEEEGWSSTMPWILSLTQRGIGQIWVHHTGHDTSRQYGTKTREWQMDAYAQFEKVQRDDTDVSFLLEFRKARERTPLNRRDFANSKIALVNDDWTHEDVSGLKKIKLSPAAVKFFECLQELTDDLQSEARIKLVLLKDWQDACDRRGLTNPEIKGHRTFHIYKRELIAKNWIAGNEGAAWILP